MKCVLLYLISLFPALVWSQIDFEYQLHDFQYVTESGGPVNHQFNFVNSGEFPAEIVLILPSCGCTVAEIMHKTIKPGQKSHVSLTYDPTERPGYFVKTTDVKFKIGADTVIKTLAVKGFVVENVIENSAESPSQYSITLPPLKTTFAYPSSWTPYPDKELKAYVNGLTFILDQHQFVQLEPVFQWDGTDSTGWQKSYTLFKRLLKKELLSRHYQAWQVLFLPLNVEEISSGNKLILRAKGYTDDNLVEPHIISLAPISHSPFDETREALALANVIHYMPIDPKVKPKKLVKSESFEIFLNKLTRNALMQGELWLTTTYHNEGVYPYHEKLLETLKAELKDNGVAESIINISPPLPISKTEEFTLAEILPPLQNQSSIDSMEFYAFNNKTTESEFQLVDEVVIQNLPAYFQLYKDNVQYLDTSSRFFHNMMEKVVREIKAGRTVEIIMESSASKAPADFSDVDNLYVARMRAENAKKAVRNYLSSNGIKDEDIHFGETVPLVSGPEYDLQHYLIQYYYYFQYIKIIPRYKPKLEIASHISPYKINFSYLDVEILSESPVFQGFVDRLADYIMRNGYAKIILESSSSKIPPKRIGSPKHLSYHRAQEAKNKLYQELDKRGINPSKLIITEERILVQGPEYNNDYDEHKSLYERFQYVKILPVINMYQDD